MGLNIRPVISSIQNIKANIIQTMQRNVLPNGLTDPISSCNFFQDQEQLIPVSSEEDISNNRSTPLNEVLQVQLKALNQIQDNDFAKMRKQRRKNVWTKQENENLIRLHEQLGNKWSAISKRFPGKTENDVKNRFFSQLRMGLRHLNKAASTVMGKKNQQIKSSVLYKIVSSCEEEPKTITQSSLYIKQLSRELKLQLFDFLKNNQLKKPFQVYQLLEKIRLFIALKNPHIKAKKQRLQPIYASIAHEESMSEESGFVAQQTKKEALCCKIKQMKTMQEDSCNEPVIKQTSIQQQQTSQNDKFIQKPSICLNNPFEQVGLWMSHQAEDSWSIDHMDQQSFMVFCYQELVFPNNHSLL